MLAVIFLSKNWWIESSSNWSRHRQSGFLFSSHIFAPEKDSEWM